MGNYLKPFLYLKKVFILTAVPACLCWGWLLFPDAGTARDTGFKYFRDYTPAQYDLTPQNWYILQDKRGVIYVANQGGLLEYDGMSWRTIAIPNLTARSIAMDDRGTVYVGGKDEIGFLAPDPDGKLIYQSLLTYLEEDKRNFGNVWKTHALKQGIFFYTKKYLFQWNVNTKKIKTFTPAGDRFNAAFSCSDNYYIHQRKVGLKYFVKGSLEFIPSDETFAAVKIFMMASYDSKRLLIGTRSNGFYLYNGKKAVPFATEADDYLKKNKLCQGIRISPNEFALATRQGGVVIIDANGRLKHIFNINSGLQDNNVKYVFRDSSGNLWLAMEKGVSKIEYASPISLHNERTGLPGIVTTLSRHGPHRHLYAGTSKGLFSLAPGDRFRPAAGVPGTCFFILSTGETLLAATTYGVFQLDGTSPKAVIEKPTYTLYRSRRDRNRVWAGTREGLVSLYPDQKKKLWQKEHEFADISQEIRTIVEDKKGNLWLGTPTQGVKKVVFPFKFPDGTSRVTGYNSSHGLPAGEIHIFWAAGHVMFATGQGIYRFDTEKNVFLPDYTLGKEFAGSKKGRGVFRIAEDKNKHIWFHSKLINFRAIPRADGTYLVHKKPFLRIPQVQVNSIYPDTVEEAVWFAGMEGLLRYDATFKKDYDLPFQALIRKVWSSGRLIYSGTGNLKEVPVIPFKERSLRFQLAAPFFEAESQNRYRCLLQGYDEDWTAWTHESVKEYTNVTPGINRLRVQAGNVYGNISRETWFQFKVLPPWYRTWWAYALYALAGVLLLILITRWRSWKLVQEKQRLEQIINERTGEIKDKNRQLEEQAVKLKEMDKIKARFFANISHEFRTPLTLIMGPLEQILSANPGKELKHKTGLMLRNSQRLLRLINQLLELSKFDSGSVQLKVYPQNLVSFLKGMTASFELLAGQRELDLVFRAVSEDITLYIDPIKMEEVMANLLANAVKFTPPGGKIIVTVTSFTGKGERFPDGYAEISVSDTGPSIQAEQLEHIFDRFYQSDSTYEFHRQGSGIGLSIAKETVELHHGEIKARCTEGEGSEFILRLPMGTAHLKPDQVAPPPGETGAPYKSKSRAYVPALDEEEEKEETPPETNAKPGLEAKNIILAVEDSADVRTYIRDALEPHYTVVEAGGGKDGIKKAQELIPDLIISDIMMPGVDGYELCRVLKKDRTTCHIPIIILTAKAEEENILEGLETGADDYITKPFSTRILCARIRNLIDLRRQFQQTLNRRMTMQPVKIALSPIDKEFIDELEAVIEANIADPEFNVEELSKKLYMGRTTLYRKIQALSGESPTDFIRSYRLKRGAELLKKGSVSVLETAFEVGFSSATYFTKCFKKKFHQLPTTFKEVSKESQ